MGIPYEKKDSWDDNVSTTKYLSPGKRSAARFLYLMGGCCILIGGVLLIVFGITLVKPYLYTMNFTTGNCTTVSYSYKGDKSCSCGRFCTSKYPCLEVITRASLDNGVQVTALLHETEYDLSDTPECTYKPHCSVYPSSNSAAVTTYRLKWGTQGRKYQCFDNPDKKTEIIRTRRGSINVVIHSFLWPGLLLTAGIIMMIIPAIKWGCAGIW